MAVDVRQSFRALDDAAGTLGFAGVRFAEEGSVMTEVPGTDAPGTDPDAADPAGGDEQDHAQWAAGEWLGKLIVDCDGEKIGKLQDVYVDVETDEPQFGTVKEGVFNRHLTFVPLTGVQVSPQSLQVTVTKEQVRSAPDIELKGEELSQADESRLYHHFEQNYTPINTESGRRLARR